MTHEPYPHPSWHSQPLPKQPMRGHRIIGVVLLACSPHFLGFIEFYRELNGYHHFALFGWFFFFCLFLPGLVYLAFPDQPRGIAASIFRILCSMIAAAGTAIVVHFSIGWVLYGPAFVTPQSLGAV